MELWKIEHQAFSDTIVLPCRDSTHEARDGDIAETDAGWLCPDEERRRKDEERCLIARGSVCGSSEVRKLPNILIISTIPGVIDHLELSHWQKSLIEHAETETQLLKDEQRTAGKEGCFH